VVENEGSSIEMKIAESRRVKRGGKGAKDHPSVRGVATCWRPRIDGKKEKRALSGGTEAVEVKRTRKKDENWKAAGKVGGRGKGTGEELGTEGKLQKVGRLNSGRKNYPRGEPSASG